MIFLVAIRVICLVATGVICLVATGMICLVASVRALDIFGLSTSGIPEARTAAIVPQDGWDGMGIHSLTLSRPIS